MKSTAIWRFTRAVQSDASEVTARDGDPIEVWGGVFCDAATNSTVQNDHVQRFHGLRDAQPTLLESIEEAVYPDDGSGSNSAGWYITTDGEGSWTGL
ncbi:hypothetical protein SAMN04488556_1393 [Halostagnicola kamekurae]|uniref:Uncharacterized protein n=1 Tax=Halostagnicola kamekurae TaxID=619731 RepID=A0A1I6QNB8_9EURY|nr:hypothetical protein SAMN04488556_1393 [Halostagnicola kamekurae]